MSYDVLIERNAIREIKKFPNHDIQRIKESLKKLAEFPAGLDVKKTGWNKKYLSDQGWRLQNLNRT